MLTISTFLKLGHSAIGEQMHSIGFTELAHVNNETRWASDSFLSFPWLHWPVKPKGSTPLLKMSAEHFRCIFVIWWMYFGLFCTADQCVCPFKTSTLVLVSPAHRKGRQWHQHDNEPCSQALVGTGPWCVTAWLDGQSVGCCHAGLHDVPGRQLPPSHWGLLIWFELLLVEIITAANLTQL